MPKSKIILVSGGNRGIGYEVCKQLSLLGHTVILAARDIDKGNAAIKQLGTPVDLLELDLNESQTFLQAHSDIEKKYGRLDVLVNNAAIVSSSKGFDTVSIKEIRKILDVNLFGTIELTQQLMPLIRNSRDGRIINVSSAMGALNDAGSGYAAYRLSKAALNAFSTFLSKDLSGLNISVNSVCPGWVQTDMGGTGASRSVEKGAETIVWLATAESIPNSKFVRDKKVISW
jgi:NAD(P)-dependent dehydrogenase (short-subunit alcohol dehydrogenase family)